MKNSTTQISYCADLVKSSDRDRFLQGFFVPVAKREGVFALLALILELSHLRHKISEEMIAHIRFAWWRENIEAIYVGQPLRQQPVLEALAALVSVVPLQRLLQLVESYQEAFPQLPSAELEEKLIADYLAGDGEGWEKAGDIIRRHRARFGENRRAWLNIELLIAGIF